MAKSTQPHPRQTLKSGLLVIGWLVGALVVVLVVVGGLGAFLGNGPELRRVGVAKIHGNLVIYACVANGIGTVKLQRGSGVDGALVWTATKTAGAPALKALPVRPSVRGYSIREFGALDQELAMRGMTDPRGLGLLRNYVVFRPAELADGTIITQGDKTQSLSSWLAASPNC